MLKKPNYLFSAADYTKLIVVGGYNGAYLDTVEVIGLEGSEDDCPDSLPPYPVTLRYPTVAILGGRVTACGGYSSAAGGNLADCYAYDQDSNAWIDAPGRSFNKKKSLKSKLSCRMSPWFFCYLVRKPFKFLSLIFLLLVLN